MFKVMKQLNACDCAYDWFIIGNKQKRESINKQNKTYTQHGIAVTRGIA
jgi:hypothetical protein